MLGRAELHQRLENRLRDHVDWLESSLDRATLILDRQHRDYPCPKEPSSPISLGFPTPPTQSISSNILTSARVKSRYT